MPTNEAKRGPRSARPDEQGFVLVWFSILFVVLLGIAAFAVDLTHARSAAQRAQNAADAAALAGVVVMPDLDAATEIARQVAADNGVNPDDVVVEAGAGTDELKVTVRDRVRTFFAPAIGIDTLSMTRSATAQYEAPEPLDMVIVLDRTGSMNPTELQNAKNAAKGVLGFLDPSLEHVALGVLGPSSTTTACANGAFGLYAGSESAPGADWVPAPHPAGPPSSDYQLSNGTLNPNSQLVKTIDCLATANRTNLGEPIRQAHQYLDAHGRTGARQGILLLSDGAANEPRTEPPCQYAFDAAEGAKEAGIAIVTIGFGVVQERCRDTGVSSYPDPTPLTKLLADMASESDDDLGCTEAENGDGDSFFCEATTTEDLQAVFLQAASQLVGRSPTLIE